jgi:pSer/pThr/pTyr-binding forkhead associated (FHA) protein
MVITVERPEGHFCVTVEKPFARIGTHGSSEVVLPQEGAPHRSLYLHATEAGVYYVRLASASENDTDSHGWLAPDQVISVGPYRIAVQLANGSAKPDALRPDFEVPETGPPRAALMIVHDGRTVAHYPLRRRLTVVGRGQRSTLRLADAQVSTAHCVLYREADRLWAIDLLSSNGTLVTGQPLEAAVVAPGQSLVLGGSVELVYTCPQENSTTLNDGTNLPDTPNLLDLPVASDSNRQSQLPMPLMDDDPDALTRYVTDRMIQVDRQAHWRRRLLAAAVGLLVLLTGVVTALLLLERYGLNP